MKNENNHNESRELRMGTAPILPLIIKMSLPSMFSMMIAALYNVVDSIYVSRLGEASLSAVSLIYPIQMLNVAVGVGTGVGLASVISRRLGQRDYEEAQVAANHGIILSTISWAVFALFGIFGIVPFVNAFSSNPALVIPAIAYGRICCVGCLFIFNATSGERIMQACGNMTAPMFCQLSGCITNIILDPIMIFGLLGCPALGVAGAAYATVIGQFVSMAVTFILINTQHLPVKVRFSHLRFSARTVKSIYQVAFPSMVMQAIGSLTNLCLNAILITFNEAAVAALGVYFKLQSFVFMPVFGLNQGTLPILGYNYGARNKARLVETFKKCLLIAFMIMLTGTIIFQVFPQVLMSLFKAEGNLMAIGVKALRTISVNFPVAALCIITGTLFQATGHGVYSLYVSVLRQIVVIVPAAWIFSRIWGVMGVWYAFPCAELMSLAATIVMYLRLYRKEIRNM